MAEFQDLREASDEKSQCLIFLTVILTWIGNKDKPEVCKHIKVFDGNLNNDLVKIQDTRYNLFIRKSIKDIRNTIE